MKFVHAADVHLGVEPNAGRKQSNNRGNEIWETFRSLIKVCEKESVDLLMIAGDLFHRQPLLRELKEVDYLFSTLSKTEVVLCVGNHDYIKKNSYYRTFKWSPNVHMILSQTQECVELPKLRTYVYGVSYYAREWTDNVYENIRMNGKEGFHILMAHGGDEKHLPFRPERVDMLGFDYVALGHIHRPQEVRPDRMWYSGALEPIDVADVGAHGYVMGNLTERGCQTDFVVFASREYVHLTLDVSGMAGFEVKDAMSAAMKEQGLKHIYKVKLVGRKDPEIRYDLTQMDPYGNIVEITDQTVLDYDFEKLYEENRENLLGKYIASFKGAEKGSIEYEALCEGVRALMED